LKDEDEALLMKGWLNYRGYYFQEGIYDLNPY
jgi:hypothetical protein